MFDQSEDQLYSRLAQIRDKQKQYPGRAPNGTGATGLLSNDAKGWSDMLNEQTEAMNIENQLGGKAPAQVRVGAPLGGMPDSLADEPAWWLQGNSNAAPSLGQIPQSVVSGDPRGALTALDALRKMKGVK